MSIHTATWEALSAFPDLLEQQFSAFPSAFHLWSPDSWEGVPSEPFSALAQLCHIRDIEIDGYQHRFALMLAEDFPFLASVDGETLAITRRYAQSDVSEVLLAIRAARAQTLALLRSVSAVQLQRRADFEGYGPVTLLALVHYLSSHDQQHLAGLQWLLGKIESLPAQT